MNGDFVLYHGQRSKHPNLANISSKVFFRMMGRGYHCTPQYFMHMKVPSFSDVFIKRFIKQASTSFKPSVNVVTLGNIPTTLLHLNPKVGTMIGIFEDSSKGFL